MVGNIELKIKQLDNVQQTFKDYKSAIVMKTLIIK